MAQLTHDELAQMDRQVDRARRCSVPLNRIVAVRAGAHDVTQSIQQAGRMLTKGEPVSDRLSDALRRDVQRYLDRVNQYAREM